MMEKHVNRKKKKQMKDEESNALIAVMSIVKNEACCLSWRRRLERRGGASIAPGTKVVREGFGGVQDVHCVQCVYPKLIAM